MTVIELGYVGLDDHDPPVPSPRASDWGRRHLRRAMAALIAVLCLVTVASSDHAPAPRGVRALWDIPLGEEDSFAVAGDTVVVHSGGAVRRLTGYGRTDGAVRWSRELGVRAPYVIAVPESGVVLLPSAPREIRPRDGVLLPDLFTQTTAVDTATGAELWHGAGDPTWAGPRDGVLLVDHPSTGPGADRVRLVGLRDGRERWSRATPGADMVSPIGPDPRRPDRVATVTRAGRARLLRLDDGADIGGGTVAWPPGSGFPFSHLEWHGDQLYVLHSTPTLAIIAGYAGQPLRERWRTDIRAGSVDGCGPVFCVTTDRDVTGHDWDTGAARWQEAVGDFTRTVGPGLVAIDSGHGSPLRIIDAATGRPIATLDGKPVEDETGTVQLMLSSSVTPAGRTVVTRVRPGTGETFTLGSIDAVTDYGCTLDGDLLICETARRRLSVTAVG
ncbi:hypothetical protein KRMM14A1004_08900 [Krasilnikovia sp. MM14-A1004]